MPKSRCNPQAPLEHAPRVERQLALELARLHQQLQTEREKLYNYMRRRAQQQASLARESQGTLDLDHIRRRQRHINVLADAVHRQKLAIAAAAQAVNGKREELAAMKRDKTLDRLRGRPAQEHRREMARPGRNIADEVAVSRHPHRPG